MDKRVGKIRENVGKVIVGKSQVVDLMITAMLANGHVLIDDVPGMGKTKLANSLALSISAPFKRIQFTPDLQPADITGIYYYNQKQGDFVFRPGPVMTSILLADEINRAVPRTQSSLLEAMEEHKVTVEGHSFVLEQPFMVIATQNPVELEGTFPLPEAQLDRFLLKLDMGYPTKEEEVSILKRFRQTDPLTTLKPVVEPADILSLRQAASQVTVSEDLLFYICELAEATRSHRELRLGLSPRACLALLKASMAYALIRGRGYVLPDDIQYLFPYVAKHRLLLHYGSESDNQSKERIIGQVLNQVPVPVEDKING